MFSFIATCCSVCYISKRSTIHLSGIDCLRGTLCKWLHSFCIVVQPMFIGSLFCQLAQQAPTSWQMDVVQMALICGVYAEQCLNRVHLLDLAGELLRVERFCCATNPTSAIIVLLPTVNLHGSLPAFIPLSICSLVALFPISYCLFQTLSPMSCCRIIEQPSHTILHDATHHPRSSLEPKWKASRFLFQGSGCSTNQKTYSMTNSKKRREALSFCWLSFPCTWYIER